MTIVCFKFKIHVHESLNAIANLHLVPASIQDYNAGLGLLCRPDFPIKHVCRCSSFVRWNCISKFHKFLFILTRMAPVMLAMSRIIPQVFTDVGSPFSLHRKKDPSAVLGKGGVRLNYTRPVLDWHFEMLWADSAILLQKQQDPVSVWREAAIAEELVCQADCQTKHDPLSQSLLNLTAGYESMHDVIWALLLVFCQKGFVKHKIWLHKETGNHRTIA